MFAALALRPLSLEGDVPHLDKLLHFGGFAVIAGAAAFGAALPRAARLHGLIFVLGGGAIELAQGALDIGRTASAPDFIADALGVAAGLWLGRIFAQACAANADESPLRRW